MTEETIEIMEEKPNQIIEQVPVVETTKIEDLLQTIGRIQTTGAQVVVNMSLKDDAKVENYSIDVGPSDFRATLKFSDFSDLHDKMVLYKKELESARENGICATPKVK